MIKSITVEIETNYDGKFCDKKCKYMLLGKYFELYCHLASVNGDKLSVDEGIITRSDACIALFQEVEY